uniref:Uncharacterized protein n=1 Tax=Oryza brachyantha TaxID=4533 RepID=J3L947_ORYBR
MDDLDDCIPTSKQNSRPACHDSIHFCMSIILYACNPGNGDCKDHRCWKERCEDRTSQPIIINRR